MTSLNFGGLCLDRSESVAQGLGFILDVSSDGTEWGNAEAVVTAIRAQLGDGDLGEVTRHENATATIRVRVEADSSDLLAAGGEALWAEVRKGRNELVWVPPAWDAEPTVFDIVWAELDFEFEDWSEAWLRREYVLTLSRLPFPRSAVEQTATLQLSEPGTSSVTVLDDGDSLTGWSAGIGPGVDVLEAVSPTLSSGVRAQATSGAPAARINRIGTPSFETSVAGWLPGLSDFSLARVGATGASGSFALRVTRGSALPGVLDMYVRAVHSVPPGPSTFSVSVRSVSVARRYRLQIVWLSAANVPIGFIDTPSTMGSTSSWTRLSVSGTRPSGAVRAQFTVYAEDTNSGEQHLIDAAMVEDANTAGTYFDGSFTWSDWKAAYSWVGTPQLSPSVLTPVSSFSLMLTRTWGTPVDTTSAPIVRIKGSGSQTFLINGAPATVLRTELDGSDTVSYLRFSGDLETLTMRSAGGPTATLTNRIAEIALLDRMPDAGTGRQRSGQMLVAGSARTGGSLTVDGGASALGRSVLVWTGPSGALLSGLRPLRVAGSAGTTDSDCASGSYNAFNTTSAFEIPAAMLPEAAYDLVLKYRPVALTASNYTVGVQVYLTPGGSLASDARPGATQGGNAPLAHPGGVPALHPVARLHLPGGLKSPDGWKVRIEITASSSLMELDDAYLFDVENGSLTIIEAASGNDPLADATKIAIQQPSLDDPLPSILATDSGLEWNVTQRAAAFPPGRGHMLDPGLNDVVILCSGAAAYTASYAYYPRWHSHARSV